MIDILEKLLEFCLTIWPKENIRSCISSKPACHLYPCPIVENFLGLNPDAPYECLRTTIVIVPFRPYLILSFLKVFLANFSALAIIVSIISRCWGWSLFVEHMFINSLLYPTVSECGNIFKKQNHRTYSQ